MEYYAQPWFYFNRIDGISGDYCYSVSHSNTGAFSDNEIYNPIDSACPHGLATAITPNGEEILVCRKNQVINEQTLTIGE